MPPSTPSKPSPRRFLNSSRHSGPSSLRHGEFAFQLQTTPQPRPSTQFLQTPRFSVRKNNDELQHSDDRTYVQKSRRRGLARVESIEDTPEKEGDRWDHGEEATGLSNHHNGHRLEDHIESQSSPIERNLESERVAMDDGMEIDNSSLVDANDMHPTHSSAFAFPTTIEKTVEGREEPEEDPDSTDLLFSPPPKRQRLNYTAPTTPPRLHTSTPAPIRRFLPPLQPNTPAEPQFKSLNHIANHVSHETHHSLASTTTTTEHATPQAATPASHKPTFLLPTRPSPTKAVLHSNPLPEVFSPHKRGQKFTKGGIADTVRGWIVEAASSSAASTRGNPYRNNGTAEAAWALTVRVARRLDTMDVDEQQQLHSPTHDENNSGNEGIPDEDRLKLVRDHMILLDGDILQIRNKKVTTGQPDTGQILKESRDAANNVESNNTSNDGRGSDESESLQRVKLLLASQKLAGAVKPGSVIGLRHPFWHVALGDGHQYRRYHHHRDGDGDRDGNGQSSELRGEKWLVGVDWGLIS